MTHGEDPNGRDLASALSAALAERSMTLVDLHKVLQTNGSAVSLSTLSRWRSGERQPDPVRSGAIIEAMEQALGTPHGALLSRLPGRSRRIGAIATIDDSVISARGRDMLAELEASPFENQRILSVHQQVDIDSRGVMVSVIATLTIQCIIGTVAAVGYFFPESGDGRIPPEYVVRMGGHRPRSLTDAETGIHGFAMDLDRPIGVGETAVAEVQILFPDATPGRNTFEMFIHRSVREIIQLFRFDPANVPYWAEEVEESKGRTRITSFLTDGQHTIHRIRSDFGPGRFAMRWGWE